MAPATGGASETARPCGCSRTDRPAPDRFRTTSCPPAAARSPRRGWRSRRGRSPRPRGQGWPGLARSLHGHLRTFGVDLPPVASTSRSMSPSARAGSRPVPACPGAAVSGPDSVIDAVASTPAVARRHQAATTPARLHQQLDLPYVLSRAARGRPKTRQGDRRPRHRSAIWVGCQRWNLALRARSGRRRRAAGAVALDCSRPAELRARQPLAPSGRSARRAPDPPPSAPGALDRRRPPAAPRAGFLATGLRDAGGGGGRPRRRGGGCWGAGTPPRARWGGGPPVGLSSFHGELLLRARPRLERRSGAAVSRGGYLAASPPGASRSSSDRGERSAERVGAAGLAFSRSRADLRSVRR
jgi:hypothetical protein